MTRKIQQTQSSRTGTRRASTSSSGLGRGSGKGTGQAQAQTVSQPKGAQRSGQVRKVQANPSDLVMGSNPNSPLQQILGQKENQKAGAEQGIATAQSVDANKTAQLDALFGDGSGATDAKNVTSTDLDALINSDLSATDSGNATDFGGNGTSVDLDQMLAALNSGGTPDDGTNSTSGTGQTVGPQQPSSSSNSTSTSTPPQEPSSTESNVVAPPEQTQTQNQVIPPTPDQTQAQIDLNNTSTEPPLSLEQSNAPEGDTGSTSSTDSADPTDPTGSTGSSETSTAPSATNPNVVTTPQNPGGQNSQPGSEGEQVPMVDPEQMLQEMQSLTDAGSFKDAPPELQQLIEGSTQNLKSAIDANKQNPTPENQAKVDEAMNGLLSLFAESPSESSSALESGGSPVGEQPVTVDEMKKRISDIEDDKFEPLNDAKTSDEMGDEANDIQKYYLEKRNDVKDQLEDDDLSDEERESLEAEYERLDAQADSWDNISDLYRMDADEDKNSVEDNEDLQEQIERRLDQHGEVNLEVPEDWDGDYYGANATSEIDDSGSDSDSDSGDSETSELQTGQGNNESVQNSQTAGDDSNFIYGPSGDTTAESQGQNAGSTSEATYQGNGMGGMSTDDILGSDSAVNDGSSESSSGDRASSGDTEPITPSNATQANTTPALPPPDNSDTSASESETSSGADEKKGVTVNWGFV